MLTTKIEDAVPAKVDYSIRISPAEYKGNELKYDRKLGANLKSCLFSLGEWLEKRADSSATYCAYQEEFVAGLEIYSADLGGVVQLGFRTGYLDFNKAGDGYCWRVPSLSMDVDKESELIACQLNREHLARGESSNSYGHP